MAEKNPVVLMSTSKGNIRIELDAEKAPITTKNFLDYVSDGHYDGLIFHRVIPGFMIQGGGMDAQMKEKKNKAPIKNEAANGLKNNLAPSRWRAPTSSTAPRRSFSSTLRITIFSTTEARLRLSLATPFSVESLKAWTWCKASKR